MQLRSWVTAASLLCVAAPPATADVAGVFKEAWKCAKSVPGSVEALGKDVLTKAEAVASMTASAATCTAGAGGQAQVLAFVTTSLGTLKATSDVLKPGCKAAVMGAAAKPLALGIAALVPDGAVKQQIEKLAESNAAATALWDQIAKLPDPIGFVPKQLNCGCDLVEGAITLSDMSTVANVIKNTSKACAGILDQAGLGFLNDWGSAAIGWIGDGYHALSSAWQGWQGKKDAAPDEAVYQGEFGAYVPGLARDLAQAAPNTDPFSLPLFAAGNGWANGKTNYQKQNKLTWAELVADCKDYYDQHKFPGDNKAKCDGFKQRAADTARKDSGRLRLQGTSMAVFRLKLDGWLKSEWVWRLPPCDTKPGNDNGCRAIDFDNQYAWNLGTFKEDKSEPWNYQATGLYARARAALPEAAYDTDLAHRAVLAGAWPYMQARTRAIWESHSSAPRNKWLAQWMPQPAFTAAYGCAAGNGAIGAACPKEVEKAFDGTCTPQLRDAYVTTPNVLAAGFRFNTAKDTCTKLLNAVVANAKTLADAGVKAVPERAQGKCPPPDKDRAAAAACLKTIADAWESCGASQVGNVLSDPVGKAKACFDTTTLKMQATVPDKKDVKAPAGGIKIK